jgi:hypothetical protein
MPIWRKFARPIHQDQLACDGWMGRPTTEKYLRLTNKCTWHRPFLPMRRAGYAISRNLRHRRDVKEKGDARISGSGRFVEKLLSQAERKTTHQFTALEPN